MVPAGGDNRDDPPVTDRIALAARNNALWVDTVCRTHGLRGAIDDLAWSAPSRTPPYYPDAVTLSPDADEHEVLARIDGSDGASVKDSWDRLDLAADDFARLATGQWLWHAGPADGAGVASAAAPALRWRRLTQRSDVTPWATAWAAEPDAAGILRPSLVEQPGVLVLAAVEGGTGSTHDADDTDAAGRVVAGAVLFASGEGDERVVGVGNVFAVDDDVHRAYREVTAFARSLVGDVPLVGWEAGPGLEAALAAGYEAVGRLSVWVR
ncbi:hypothetical protein DFJ68_1118 [Terracoccus luteus]|uniref:GNAT acetyltransferase-like protein n=1 Tax=Terracoccus luteus TaxID=53356 RepID=A0A495XXW6_9MICO|nr:hypothetical protein DFJ68_1118 [Terracoccus luteus]